MATIHSPLRKFLKPILFALFGKSLYPWFQHVAKVRDIDMKLVEEKEMELLPYFIDKNSEAIDIGANYAYFTVRMAHLGRKIYSFEPIPFTFKVCKMVVNHYKLKNVILYQNGVGERNEVRKFSVPIMTSGAISAGQSHFEERENEGAGKELHVNYEKTEIVSCEVLALDSLSNDFDNISFVKMDIEGAEYFALKGMAELIRKFKPVILLEINPFFLKGFNLTDGMMKELINGMGYEVFIYSENTKKLCYWDSEFIESNYIIIHRDKLNAYKMLIKHEK